MTSRPIRIILIAAAGLLLLAVVSAGLAYRFGLRDTVNEWRAARMLEKAESAFSGENWTDAARLARAAHFLDRDNRAIDLLVARSLMKLRDPGTVDWWKRVLDEPELPVDELRTVTRAVLRQGNLADGLMLLAELFERDPDGVETSELWLTALGMQRRYGTLRAQLERLLEGGGVLSVKAARELVARPGAEANLRQRAAAVLLESGKDPLDRLYGLAIRDGGSAAVGEAVQRLMDQPTAADLEALLRWAVWSNREHAVLAALSFGAYRQSGAQPGPWLNALYRTGNYPEIISLTGENNRDAASLAWRALAFSETGEKERALTALDLAIETARPEDYPLIESTLAGMDEWERLKRFLEARLKEAPGEPGLLVRLLGAEYHGGDAFRMAVLLRKIEAGALEDQPVRESFTAYLRLLEEGFMEETHANLEDLVARYPEVAEYRLVLALSFLLQGRFDLARGLAAETARPSPGAPRHLRVAASILGIPDLLAPKERASLLPQERLLLKVFAGAPAPPE